MPREHKRGSRISDLIQRELSSIIQLEMRDPRIGMVTINEVKASRDLAFADVYVTFLGIDSTPEAAIEVLNKAGGFLRSQLAKQIKVRSTPKLRFHYDETVIGGRQMSDLIDAALEQDRLHHQDPVDD